MNKNMTTTSLQFKIGIGVDVLLDHLHNLKKEHKINKYRKGKRYVWSYNGN